MFVLRITWKSSCLFWSSARCLFSMCSASLLTFTMWSLVEWEMRRPSLTSSMNDRPACFCREICHSWLHSSITSSIADVPTRIAVRPKHDANKRPEKSERRAQLSPHIQHRQLGYAAQSKTQSKPLTKIRSNGFKYT